MLMTKIAANVNKAVWPLRTTVFARVLREGSNSKGSIDPATAQAERAIGVLPAARRRAEKVNAEAKGLAMKQMRLM